MAPAKNNRNVRVNSEMHRLLIEMSERTRRPITEIVDLSFQMFLFVCSLVEEADDEGSTFAVPFEEYLDQKQREYLAFLYRKSVKAWTNTHEITRASMSEDFAGWP